MESDGMVDTSTEAALKSLNDIVVPPPISYIPQTWGWAALAVIFAMLLALGLWRWIRRWQANRYRREALAELETLSEHGMMQNGPARFDQELAELLKRTALAAWPREEVAKLSGSDWAAFLKRHGTGGDVLAGLVDEREYRTDIAPTTDERARLVEAARRWIEDHHVSA
ncbi:DUF4381 domain-containing protein [Rhizobium sp. TH2]|uniref:DUF4381 domain-containing protein n=1 Tax=Rhizobium sp. TH2 TaxID=2775403 RepID=UPI0021578364|nr:DUF4381 domain-containing protein [Rhizobium sp. TH2]UVC11867.1 DUF4381 domain-containing protein [Rhizobium sp. TH2]